MWTKGGGERQSDVSFCVFFFAFLFGLRCVCLFWVVCFRVDVVLPPPQTDEGVVLSVLSVAANPSRALNPSRGTRDAAGRGSPASCASASHCQLGGSSPDSPWRQAAVLK